MREILALLVFLFPCLLVSSSGAELKAGTALVDVTPEKFPVIVNGMFNSRTATGALDELHARCLVLDDGSTRIAMCVVDSCMMPRELLDRAKAAASKPSGIPIENMCVSATHTHSAPAAMGCLGTDPDPVYPAFLETQIARAITLAAKDLKPARAGWAVTHAPRHTFNRRWILRSDKIRNDPFGQPTVRANMHPGYQHPDFVGPSGPVDDALTLLSVQTSDGKPLCVLANFSMHYFGSGIVSSDYFGPFCDKLAKKVGGGLAIMSQGTSGDLMWMDYGSPEKKITLDEYAEQLARIAYAALPVFKYTRDVPLKMEEVKLTLERRVPDEKRLKWAREVLERVKDGKVQTQQEIYAREALFLHDEPRRELKLQAIVIDGEWIAAIPNEVFAITALRMKEEPFRFPKMIIELANGAEGYIPPPEQHDLGGYTTWPARTAALESQAEPKIVGLLLKTIGRIRPLGGSHAVGIGRYTGAVSRAQPEGYWQFEEFIGSAAKCYERKTDGVYEPGIARALRGPYARCAQFAGGRMKANLKDLGPTYTAEFWLWNGFPTDARPVTGYLFSRGEDGAKDAPGDHFGIGGTAGHAGKLIFASGNAKNQTLAGSTPLKLREWHHVALVRDGKKVAVYLDGKPELAGEAEVTVPAGCGQVFFGGRNDKAYGFEGRLDEAAIYNRSLTAKEIAEHYAAAGK